MILSPLSRQCKNRPPNGGWYTLLGGDFVMAKKGQTFQRYSEELKSKAVEMYNQNGHSYREIAKKLGVLNPTQIKNWVKKSRNGESLLDKRGTPSKSESPLVGRPRSKFQSVEEERDYLKAQVEYLKKRNPNLHKGDRYGR